MQEKTLLKISLITSVTGIALLFLISLNTNANEKEFQLLGEDDYALVSGKIERISSKGNVTFLSIYQSKPINAVVIGKDYVDLKSGDYVEVRGIVEDYKGVKELVVEEIRKI